MRRLALASGAFVLVAVVAPRSEAHFILKAPPNWMVQDNAGFPEKLGPCGDEYDGTEAGMPSGIVTAYQQGDTVTITIDEVVFHPGHYRISIGDPDRDALPPEPPVEAGTTPCGTVPIEDPPVYPVLADNVFPHTTAFTTPQTTTIKLPSNISCTKCTLQVIEFMSDHGLNVPGGCFYHHCADVSIGVVGGDGGGTPPPDGGGIDSDGSTSGMDGAPGGENETTSGGCGCSVPGGASPIAAAGLAFVLGLAARWRRRGRGKTTG